MIFFTNVDFYCQLSHSFKGFWSKKTTFFKTLHGDELYALFISHEPENYTLLSRERHIPVKAKKGISRRRFHKRKHENLNL